MMGDGSLCLYKPGDQISVTQLDGTNKVYDVLAVVSIPSALQTPLQVDMGLDYIFPTNELFGKYGIRLPAGHENNLQCG